ncbi:MAG: hypothetical protein IT350_00840 [Deltaproteobacteria bacterium]|nr:hypothetical protein [Deltaproteobacteria bacterium]
MKKVERLRRLKLDGEEVAEVDYSCLHVSMLYARRGVGYVDDAYRVYPEGDPRNAIVRKSAKRALLAALNCDGGLPGAASVVRKKMMAKGGRKTVRRFEAVIGESVYEMVVRLASLHPTIRDVLGTGIWGTCQRWDSDLMVRVLVECVRTDMAVLPIHDSLLCPASRADEAMSIMRRCYRDEFGFDIEVKKVEPSEVEEEE